jgi:hypothetical protein
MKTRQASFHFCVSEESPKGEDRLHSWDNINALGQRFSKGATRVTRDLQQVPGGSVGTLLYWLLGSLLNFSIKKNTYLL